MLEPKDQIKERLGYSPDYFDALGETFAMEDAPRELGAELRGFRKKRRVETEFDPYAYQDDEGGRVETDFNPFEFR
jgi:hypothetical protein